VVSSEQEEVLRVLYFVTEEKSDRLDRLLSTVNIVSKEEIVSFRREASVFEDSQQVIVLAVNIT